MLLNIAPYTRCAPFHGAVTVADYRRGLGMLSGAFPAKLKAIRILHPTRALRVALSIALPLLSAKMRARCVTPKENNRTVIVFLEYDGMCDTT